MRLAIASLALLATAQVLASATGNYRPGTGCPHSRTCTDTIEVSISPDHRGEGGIFVGILPILDGKPSLPAGWFDPSGSVQVASSPIAHRTGPLQQTKLRLTVPGGVCSVAARNGVSGELAVYAGYGVSDQDMMQRIASIEDRLRQADPTTQEKAREAVERIRALNPAAMSAAQNMLDEQTYWLISRIDCP